MEIWSVSMSRQAAEVWLHVGDKLNVFFLMFVKFEIILTDKIACKKLEG